MPKIELQSDQEILRTGCGLLDRSDRGKLALTGPEAKSFLHGQVTNDVEGLSPGEGCYAAFLNPKGKMQGDLRILDTGDELWLDTEREALQPLFTMIHRYKLGSDLELHKRTLQQGLLSLIGPQAREIAGAEDLAPTEHANAQAEIDGIPVLLVATDAGVDLVTDAERTQELADALRARGARDVAEGAAEALRVQRGRPRFGREMDESTIPQEAGINERAVSFTKGCYVGQETVARLHYRGKPNRHLRGLRLSGPAETGAELRLGDKVVGRVGTVAGERALAIVRREAEPGATLTVGEGEARAEVVELPFEDAPR
jgi:folate-binding protein YgfZ